MTIIDTFNEWKSVKLIISKIIMTDEEFTEKFFKY